MSQVKTFQQELEKEAIITRKMLSIVPQRQIRLETASQEYEHSSIECAYCRASVMDWLDILTARDLILHRMHTHPKRSTIPKA